MRICYIGDGESVHNHFMVEWFLRQGHDILFLTDTPEHFPFPQVLQTVSPRHGGGPFRHLVASWRVRRRIRHWKPDIVHAHNVTGYGYWGALCGFSPFVLTAWGSDLNILAQKSSLLRWVVSYTLRRADLITGDAEALCQTARDLSGKKIDIRLLQWGIDFTQFQKEPDPAWREHIRADARIVFLSTRRLRSIYNIDAIIKAFAQTLPQLPSSRLVIVGEDNNKQDLENLVHQLHIGERVLFTGWLPQEKLVDTLLSSDIFVSVPSSDSTALSLLEAFAARLPVIVSDLPANYEWIDTGKNGLLVTPGDANQLASAMMDMARNPDRQQWGEINRRIVQERGDREKEMRKLEEWYEESCRVRPGAPIVDT